MNEWSNEKKKLSKETSSFLLFGYLRKGTSQIWPSPAIWSWKINSFPSCSEFQIQSPCLQDSRTHYPSPLSFWPPSNLGVLYFPSRVSVRIPQHEKNCSLLKPGSLTGWRKRLYPGWPFLVNVLIYKCPGCMKIPRTMVGHSSTF